jgi:hypothetical protein
MKYKIDDAIKYLVYNDELFQKDMFFYEKQIDLHIWTVYSINTFKGYEVHYNEITDTWSHYPWKIETPLIQELMVEKSYVIEGERKNEKDTCPIKCYNLGIGRCDLC